MAALNCHTISKRDILYVTSNFCSSLLIDKDELVMPRVSMVIEHPAISRVIRVFIDLYTSISDTKLGRGRGRSLDVVWAKAMMAGTRSSVQVFIASESKGFACL